MGWRLYARLSHIAVTLTLSPATTVDNVR